MVNWNNNLNRIAFILEKKTDGGRRYFTCNVNIMGRLHDKSLKITLSLSSRLTAVDCIKSGLTSLRLTLSLNSRLLAVDCMKQV